MANHGYCKNCWWWNRTGKTTGHCIMQSYSPDAMVRADENSYCPDYHNREKANKNNALGLYTEEPMLYYNVYFEGPYKSQVIELDEESFPEVTFENSPQQVEIKLVEK